jgi:protein Tex
MTDTTTNPADNLVPTPVTKSVADYAAQISAQLGIARARVAAAIELLDAGNTLPFIARYRKEATGELDEEQLRAIIETLEGARALDERRAAIVATIAEQGKLTPELQAQLDAAATRTELEDLYAPYKQKRRTRAGIARERGLQPLADLMIGQALGRETPETLAMAYLNDQVPDVEAALAGARDIAAEAISDHPDVRRSVREKALRFGTLAAGKIDGAEDERSVFQLYYDFSLRVDKLRPHQILALNRGESLKVLRVSLDVPDRDWRTSVLAVFKLDPRSPWAQQLVLAAEDSAQRLLLPAIERDVRSTLTELAERHAITVFAANLRGLLSQPPLAGHTVLGVDPGFRTGCKVAVVDASGKLLDTVTIYPHAPQNRQAEALDMLRRLVQKHHVSLISIGNGTASRETEQLVAALIRSLPGGPRYIIANEAGASVYSASPLARAEMPELDVSMRGAVSIARRVQDPLAELVKIDPKSIGVGMYQHDVDQKELERSLDGVVESVVNRVGVDANTASPALLTHVAGIGPKLAEKIVAHRNENGPFPNRAALKKVPSLGPKAFEQAAGFLRIRDGDEPLDASAIHPESYGVARKLLKRTGLNLNTPPNERAAKIKSLTEKEPLPALAAELGAGEPTVADILEQIVRPGRDPRADLPAPLLRSDVLSMDDLLPGLELKGTVRNVVDFGVFIDIGVKQDGLLHRSQLPFGTVLQVGDVVDVQIQNVDKERGRIALTWPGSDQKSAPAQPARPAQPPKPKVDWAIG